MFERSHVQRTMPDEACMPIYLKGAGGAPGIALGRAARYLPALAALEVNDEDPEAALARFTAAQAAAASALDTLATRLRAEGRAQEAGIFDAQALLVEDQFLSDEV